MSFTYVKDLEQRNVMNDILSRIKKDMEYYLRFDSLRMIPREDFYTIYLNEFVIDCSHLMDEFEESVRMFGIRELLKLTGRPKPSVFDLFMSLCILTWESRDKKTQRSPKKPIGEYTQQLRRIRSDYQSGGFTEDEDINI